MRYFAVLAVLFLSGCVTLGITMHDAPTGFNGVEFGQPVDQTQNLTLITNDGKFSDYRRVDDNLMVAGISAESITYRFFEGKFSEGVVYFKGLQNYDRLKTSFSAKYGWPTEQKVQANNLMLGSFTGTAHLVQNNPKETATWFDATTVIITMEYASGEGIMKYQSRKYPLR